MPLAIGASASLLRLSLRSGAVLCAVLFAWMAAGCLINARRCRRVHCYISGPVLLLGAIFAALVAAGAISLGQQAFGNAVSAIFVGALLSFVPEILWNRYA